MHDSLAPEHDHETLLTALVFGHGLTNLCRFVMGLAVPNTLSRLSSTMLHRKLSVKMLDLIHSRCFVLSAGGDFADLVSQAAFALVQNN